jgi:hypothetical protein
MRNLWSNDYTSGMDHDEFLERTTISTDAGTTATAETLINDRDHCNPAGWAITFRDVIDRVHKPAIHELTFSLYQLAKVPTCGSPIETNTLEQKLEK